jgi:hypothetical protein
LTNEAAERLRGVLQQVAGYAVGLLDDALAAERKATVEHLRKRLGLETISEDADIVFSPGVLQKILNEVAG